MKKVTFAIAALSIVLAAGPVSAASFVLINGDVAGEGLNDPTPVSPVGGNTGTTLGEQRLIVLQAVADAWAARLVSSVEIRIMARFNPMGNCDVLGSTGPGTAFMNFPGAPVPNVYYHSSVADSITGVDQNPGVADFFITYNSDWDDPNQCTPPGFYYGLDGENPVGAEDLFPVVLHEMGHGLGFASFVNPANGVNFFGAPGIFDYFILDMTSGLHWTEMNNGQRAASATNDQNLVWDGPAATAEAFDTLAVGAIDLEVTAPPVIAGTYAAQGGLFGSMPMDDFSGDFELVNTGTATPADGCDPLIGFTPGMIAIVDRGDCEFGLKALNAQDAGASAVLVANNQGGTALVGMLGGEFGDQVTVPVAMVGETDGITIKAELPGVSGVMTVLNRLGLHESGYPLLYAPTTVNPGSSVSHWDVTAGPDLMMEPFTSEEVYDDLDITPAQLKDIGQAVTGLDDVFADGFESGDTSLWDSTTP